jgi:hypothetical protein
MALSRMNGTMPIVRDHKLRRSTSGLIRSSAPRRSIKLVATTLLAPPSSSRVANRVFTSSSWRPAFR